MPISFGCHQCGKQLQARDEFGGRRLKCPGCGTILTIPGGSAAVTAPTPAPPPPTPSSGAEALVKFVCVCGRKMKARRTDAGAEIECPDCSRVLKVPREDTDEPPAAPPEIAATLTSAAPPPPVPPPVAKPPAPARAAFNPWADHSLEQRTTPWKDAATRARNRDGKDPVNEGIGTNWSVLFVLLVIALGFAALVYYWPEIDATVRANSRYRVTTLPPTGNPNWKKATALDLVPANAFSIWSWRGLSETVDKQEVIKPLADAVVKAETKDLYQGPTAKMMRDLWQELARQEATDVLRLTRVVPALTGVPTKGRLLKSEDEVFLFDVSKPIDKVKLEKGYLDQNYVVTDVRGARVWTPAQAMTKPGQKEPRPEDIPALCLVNDHLFAVGRFAALKRLMSKTPGGLARGPLTALIDQIGSGYVMGGINFTDHFVDPAGAAPELAGLTNYKSVILSAGIEQPPPIKPKKGKNVEQPRAVFRAGFFFELQGHADLAADGFRAVHAEQLKKFQDQIAKQQEEQAKLQAEKTKLLGEALLGLSSQAAMSSVGPFEVVPLILSERARALMQKPAPVMKPARLQVLEALKHQQDGNTLFLYVYGPEANYATYLAYLNDFRAALRKSPVKSQDAPGGP